MIMIARCNIFRICITIFLIPAATVGIFEEIPLFDWASLEKDVRSVPCEHEDDGWACSSNHETSTRCHCDSDCTTYGDCCLDRAKTRLGERKTALYEVRNTNSSRIFKAVIFKAPNVYTHLLMLQKS